MIATLREGDEWWDCLLGLQPVENLIAGNNREGKTSMVCQVLSGLFSNMGMAPLHDLGERVSVEESEPHGYLGLLSHDAATVQRDRLNLGDLILGKAIVDTLPCVQHLIRPFGRRFIDGDDHPLVLRRSSGSKGVRTPCS